MKQLLTSASLLAALSIGAAIGYKLPRESSPVSDYRPNIQAPKHFRAETADTGQVAVARPPQAPAAEQAPRSAQLQELGEQQSIFDLLYRAYQIAAQADRDTLERLLLEASEQRDVLYHYHVADIFLERMTAIDPLWTIAVVESIDNQRRRNRYLASVLNSWARSDEDAVFNYYQGLENRQLQEQLAAQLVGDSSLTEGFRRALVGQLGPNAQYLTGQIDRANSTPEEAFFRAAEGNGQRRDVYRAANRWYQEDPEAALEAALALPPSQQRSMALQAMLQQLAARDPQAALALLRDQQLTERGLEDSIMHQVAHRDPMGSRLEIEAYTERTGNLGPMGEMLSQWVLLEPTEAQAYAESLPPHQQQRVIHSMANQYLQNDPEQALPWLLGLEAQYSGLIAHNIAQGSERTLEVAQSLLDSGATEGRDELAYGIAMHRGRRDPEGTLQWLQQFEGEDLYGRAVGEVIGQMAEADPLGAASRLSQQGYGQDMSQAYTRVTHSMARRHPEDARNWAVGLPESPARNAAIGALVQTTAQRDPETAKELLQELPPGQARDRAAAGLAAQLSRGNRAELQKHMRELGVSQEAAGAFLTVWGDH